MRRLVVLVGLIGHVGAASAAPEELKTLIHQHCVRCHNEDHPLDLTVLPDDKNVASWLGMLDMLESYRMPPPAKAGTGEIGARFPISPRDRVQLIKGISAVLGPALDPPQLPLHMSLKLWRSIVTELTSPFVPAEALAPIFALTEGNMGEEDTRMLPYTQVLLDQMSARVCTALSKAELARSTPARKLIPSLPTCPPTTCGPTWDRLVRPLFHVVFAADPTSRDIEEGRRMLIEMHRLNRDAKRDWVGLCTHYLSSPRLLYASFVEGR
jgi:hypothetical protein